MLKILLCCGGGFSSSYIMTRVQKQIEEEHMEDEVSIDFSPFKTMDEVYKGKDIIVCCPHLEMEIKLKKDLGKIDVPMYLLPPKMYGNLSIKDLLQDCHDIIDLWNENPVNPVHFPGEDKVMKIHRPGAYAFYKK